ncbi:MAG: response regulator, partial [Zoogloea sp.]|uniref:response regulator n=1 Tax=Zoogloea sp. TaxID=49181 RepID=UPI003F382A00
NTWRGLIHPDDSRALWDDVSQHARNERKNFERDCRFRGKSGQWHWQRVAGQIISRGKEGQPLRALVVISDVDQARRTEAALMRATQSAESASRARSAFLANMSHEIRTPMNAVLGMTELALGTKLDGEQRHYLDIVKSSAETLLNIINDILDFSKMEAGKLEVERMDFSVRTTLTDAVRSIALKAQEKGLEVVIQIDRQVPDRMLGDPLRLRQVMTNLVSNAIKFTEAGEIAIEVSPVINTDQTCTLRCCVRDTGIGIPADKQQAIFDAFTQADLSITRRFGGTGLGLAISSKLVELMGGRIWVESQPGEGSRFYFTLQLGLEASPTEAAQAASKGQRVLLAARNPSLRMVLASALEQAGYGLVTASDTATALQLTLSQPDLHLLVADGALLLSDSAALVTAWNSIGDKRPVVAMHTLPDYQSAAAQLGQLGVKCHVAKPVTGQELAETLKLLETSPSGGGFELEQFTVDHALTQATSPELGLSVLVVEDNPINQELAVKLLEKLGHQVSVAGNGQEALDILDKSRFDVIFMDMQMPVMGGIEATEAIREREMRRSWVLSINQSHTAYIIAMTANAMVGDRERCLDAGMNDYVSKPIQVDELKNALMRACVELGRPVLHEPPPAPPRNLQTGPGIDLAATEKDLGDRALVLDLAQKFLDQWDRWINTLSNSYETRNSEILLRDAHTIKGLLAMFHADNARNFAQDLERATRDKQWEKAGQHLDALRAEMARIKPLLSAAVDA